MKDAAERKRDERARMRADGFILRQFWVHPDDWQAVTKYLRAKLRGRTIRQTFENIRRATR